MIMRSSLCIYMRFNETSPLHILILAQFFFHLKEMILWHKNFSTTVLYSICNLAAICMIITHWNQLLWQHRFDTGDSINHRIGFSSHEQKSGHVVFSFDENRSTKLKGVPFAQNMHTPFGNLNSALHSGGFHPGGNIDSCQKKFRELCIVHILLLGNFYFCINICIFTISPNIVIEFCGTDDSSSDIAKIEANPIWVG